MQKLINRPEGFVEEMLDGILLAYPDQLRCPEPRVLLRKDAPVAGKVGIATGGGSGHLPLFLGYIGSGLADGAAIGSVFASPSAEQMLAVTRAVDGGRGVLHLYGNYSGDTMNFSLAAELAAADGISTSTAVAHDDVASAPRGEEARRRGIAGIFFLYKIAGALAETGASLEDVAGIVGLASSRMRSIGVALAPCIVPTAGRPTFELSAGEMEIGMGIHGEPGVRRSPLETADAVTDQLIDALLADLSGIDHDQVDVLINGLGATPPEELFIVFRRAAARLQSSGVGIRRAWIGEYATSLEMAGASISLLVVNDELAGLLDAPASSPFFERR